MNPNVYEKQKLRHVSRKIELIKMMGGKCCLCGYDKNYAALDFHHINPSEKSFQLDGRHLSNCSINSIIEESKNAAKKGASIIVFPELSITGYTCGDLFFQRTLQKGAEDALKEIISATKSLNSIIFAGTNSIILVLFKASHVQLQ